MNQSSPATYLSRSNGKYRVIDRGLPISVDKDTAAEAMQVCRQFHDWFPEIAKMWDGDQQQFVPLPEGL